MKKYDEFNQMNIIMIITIELNKKFPNIAISQETLNKIINLADSILKDNK